MPKMERESSVEIDKRADLAQEFYDAVFNADEHPYFVSDRASLYDIFAGDETELVERCRQKYGVRLQEEHFRIPLWRLLDYLEENRRGRGPN